MLANISVCRGTNINIVGAIQMYIVAWKAFSAATVVNFHKAGIVLQDECECEIKSESDADMVNSWQHLCQWY
jgi:hypothetical protein